MLRGRQGREVMKTSCVCVLCGVKKVHCYHIDTSSARRPHHGCFLTFQKVHQRGDGVMCRTQMLPPHPNTLLIVCHDPEQEKPCGQ